MQLQKPGHQILASSGRILGKFVGSLIWVIWQKIENFKNDNFVIRNKKIIKKWGCGPLTLPPCLCIILKSKQKNNYYGGSAATTLPSSELQRSHTLMVGGMGGKPFHPHGTPLQINNDSTWVGLRCVDWTYPPTLKKKHKKTNTLHLFWKV